MAGKRVALFVGLLAIGLGALPAARALAHCDGLDGPVVEAARDALEKGDVNRVLIWVREADEAEIRRAFAHTLSVRTLGPQARELADTYFFETLVRIHRAGEGAPFTGLAPAGRDLGPAIPAADRALKSGELASLDGLLVERVRRGLADRFERAVAARKFAPEDVERGREYVESYVEYIHYVERLFEAATRPLEGHYPEVPSVHPESREHSSSGPTSR